MFLLATALLIAAHLSRQRGENLLALGFVGLCLLFFVPSWPLALWNAVQGIPGHLPAGLIGNIVMLAVAVVGIRYVFSLVKS
jgi:hypothetical protein